jgi:hypothetical protein
LDIIEKLNTEKPSCRPSKWPQKLKIAKNSKLQKLPENCFEPDEKGGCPLISTWINIPSLGINGIHYVDFMGERGKRLNPGAPLALLETLQCGRMS